MAANISMISIHRMIIIIENVKNSIRTAVINSTSGRNNQTLIKVRFFATTKNCNFFYKRKFCFSPLEKCWFCLSSPSVEKHLVITIGDSFYLALAKGPINQYHVLILSVTHIQSAALLSGDDWFELEKFKSALKDFFAST